MERSDFDEKMNTVAHMVLSVLCNARSGAESREDYECYERAIDAVVKVKVLRDQRDKALADLARLDFGEGGE